MRKYRKPSTILSKAANMFESGKMKWNQGSLYRDKEGFASYDSRFNSNAIYSCCSIGIINLLSKDYNCQSDSDYYLTKVIKKDIIDWNDSSRRKLHQIISAFKKAAELALQDKH